MIELRMSELADILDELAFNFPEWKLGSSNTFKLNSELANMDYCHKAYSTHCVKLVGSEITTTRGVVPGLFQQLSEWLETNKYTVEMKSDFPKKTPNDKIHYEIISDGTILMGVFRVGMIQLRIITPSYNVLEKIQLCRRVNRTAPVVNTPLPEMDVVVNDIKKKIVDLIGGVRSYTGMTHDTIYCIGFDGCEYRIKLCGKTAVVTNITMVKIKHHSLGTELSYCFADGVDVERSELITSDDGFPSMLIEANRPLFKVRFANLENSATKKRLSKRAMA